MDEDQQKTINSPKNVMSTSGSRRISGTFGSGKMSKPLNSSANNFKQSMGKKEKDQEAQPIARFDAHQYESKIQELLELIDIQEQKLKLQDEQKYKLLNKLKDVEKENRDKHAKIEELLGDRNQKSNEILELNTRLLDLNTKSKFQTELAKSKFDIVNKEIYQKDSNLKMLQSHLDERSSALKTTSVNNDYTQNENLSLRTTIDTLNRERSEQKGRIKELEDKLDEIYTTRKSESALLLELTHLRNDNIRLLNMLKTTEEFKDFAYLAEDCSGGIRYVKAESAYGDCSKSGGVNAKCKCTKSTIYPNGKCCKDKGGIGGPTNNSNKTITCKIKECISKKMEEDSPFNDINWVPAEAFEYISSFNTKYRVSIDDTLSKELLFKLNLIWIEREKSNIQRVRNQYQNEILDLRRRLNNKESSDIIYTKTENKKLKDELKSARLDNRILKKNEGLEVVNSALKVASTFHKTKKDLENEINRLKQINQAQEESKQSRDNFERLKFNEGAFWIVSRVIGELETFCMKLDEFKMDFEKRLSGLNFETDLNKMIVANSKSWLFSCLFTTAKELVEQFGEWRSSAQKNVDSVK